MSRNDSIYGTESYKQKRMRMWQLRGIKIDSYHEYELILEAQGHICAICPNPVNGSGHLDHDHTTGIIRGILCGKCNLMLGQVETLLDNMQNYLSNYRRSNLCDLCGLPVDHNTDGAVVHTHDNTVVHSDRCYASWSKSRRFQI